MRNKSSSSDNDNCMDYKKPDLGASLSCNGPCVGSKTTKIPESVQKAQIDYVFNKIPVLYCDSEENREQLATFSELLSCFIVPDEELKQVATKNVIDHLKQFILMESNASNRGEGEEVNRILLRLAGPAGCGKSHLIQALYCCFLQTCSDKIVPFYIDLTMYRLDSESEQPLKKNEVSKKIKTLIASTLVVFQKEINNNPDKTPLLFIDGVYDYRIGKSTPLGNLLWGSLSNVNCDIIVAVDTCIISTRQNQYDSIQALCQNRAKRVLSFKPIDTARVESVSTFLDLYKRTFGVRISDALQHYIEQVPLRSIDIFIVKNFIASLGDIISNNYTISELYNNICQNLYGDSEGLGCIAQEVFDFSYGENKLTNYEVYVDGHWHITTRHSSIVEFLISYYYIEKLKGFNTENDIPFFNQILPKEVTRFIVPLMNSDQRIESNVVDKAEKFFNHEKMNHLGRSEINYLLGRIKSPQLKERACMLLSDQYKEAKRKYEEKLRNRSNKEFDLKIDLFILRSYAISLVYQYDRNVTREYLTSLIVSKQANEINRGFHLEYYGDKPYMPTLDVLDFHDNISVGEQTILTLIRAIEKTNRNNVNTITCVNIFTLCSLLQARINNSWSKMFYQKCLNILEEYVEIVERIIPELSNYFDMIQEDFFSYVISDGDSTINTYMFSTLISLTDRKSAGWVQLGVPEAESIMEHIYSAWLFGLLFLPESDEKHDDYNKATILQMLLIHDIAKSIIDDIDNIEKTGDRERYNQIEDHTMRKLLLKGTYPDMGNLYPYIEIWNKWMEGMTFNAKVAREIDIIQRLFMLMHYHLIHPKEVTDHDVEEWFSIDVPTIQTDIGQDLLRRVVKKKS